MLPPLLVDTSFLFVVLGQKLAELSPTKATRPNNQNMYPYHREILLVETACESQVQLAWLLDIGNSSHQDFFSQMPRQEATKVLPVDANFQKDCIHILLRHQNLYRYLL